MVSLLSARERRVLNLRHGLIDGHMRSQEQVAKRFGVSVERIREIEEGALRKLTGFGLDAAAEGD